MKRTNDQTLAWQTTLNAYRSGASSRNPEPIATEPLDLHLKWLNILRASPAHEAC